MIIRIALGAATAALLSSSVFAADIYSDEGDYEGSYKDTAPYYAAPFSWTGLYVGGHIGYASGDSDISSEDGGFDETPGGISFETDGIIGGGQIGYNWQTGNFVIGIEAEGGYLGAEGDEFIVDDPDNFGETEFNAYGVLAARLGLASEKALFYVKGGWAFADVETAAGDLINGSDDIDDTDLTILDDTLSGYAIGGGLEYAVSSNWTVKAEYLYLDFDDETTGNNDGDSFNHENDLHTVKLGVNYKFGGHYDGLK